MATTTKQGFEFQNLERSDVVKFLRRSRTVLVYLKTLYHRYSDDYS